MRCASTCYMCDSPETSREHAPPLCFFPQANDIGRDLRRNLVTVPSCDRHNSRKSKDDEYFRAVILMTAAQDSDTGRHQFFRKFIPASARMPHAHRSFFADKGTIAEGKSHVLQIDRQRFDGCVDHLARALFFAAFQRKWNLPINAISPNFFSGIASDNVLMHQPTMDTIQVSRQFLASETVRGRKPRGV
ncbi:MAG: hypothetical protein K0S58_3222 [Nitrospira sp.]|nr:hypothetical protein [Nitrospira sp.]